MSTFKFAIHHIEGCNHSTTNFHSIFDKKITALQYIGYKQVNNNLC